jgi:putative ABC transport system permease protein
MLGVLLSMYSFFFLTPASPDQALRLIVRNRISIANPLPVAYIKRIKTIPGVRDVMIQQWFGGTYKDSREPRNNFARFAAEPEKLFTMNPEFSISSLQKRAFLRQQDSCILTRTLAERLGLRVGDRITLTGNIFRVTLSLIVAGVYDSPADPEALYFHNRYLNQSLRERPDFAIMLLVLADSPEETEPVARRIDGMFSNSTTQTKTEAEKGLQLSFVRFLGNLKLFLVIICAALTGTAVLVSANTVAMGVRERMPEVGILKALGFSPGVVLWLIVGESMLMAMLGGLIGFMCADAIIGEIRRLPVMLVNLPRLAMSPAVAAMGILLATLVGLLASLAPAWEASKRAIVDCLSFAD